ncbi:MFS transporter, partial [Bacillus anthracis]
MEVSIGPNELKKFRLVMGAVLLLTVLTQLIDNAFMLITPILVENFSISTDVGSWVASIGGIGIAIGFLAFSSFADFFSEKKLLVIGLLLFCLPSITGILFQSSYYMVVISRFVQAIGGISTSALYLVLIARYLPKKEQVIWMGLCTTSFTVSTVIGTVTGGYLSTYFGWQFIFYIPFIGLLALPIILKYLPNNPKIKSDLDFVGFLILAVFAICMNFLISNPTIILLIVTIALVVVFWVYISKARNPFVSIAFFKNRDYIITLAATFFYYLSQVALVFITPFLLQRWCCKTK